jgi:RND family efflux transporter MFP subunit
VRSSPPSGTRAGSSGGPSAREASARPDVGDPLPGERAPSPRASVDGEAPARIAPIEDVFLLTGELSAVHSLDLSVPRSETWNLQIKALVEDGMDVKEGDSVIEFDNSSVVATLEEKRLARIQSEIGLESRSAALEAEGEEKRFAHERALIAAERARTEAAVPQELMARREWQEKQAALRQAEAALEKARLDLEAFATSSKAEIENLKIARDKATREIEAARQTLDALAVDAPKPGIVVIGQNWNEDRKFQVGDSVWPGLTVASIPDLREMEVVAYLADVDDGRIAPGMKVRCIPDTYPDRTFTGRVAEVSSVADRKGFRARVSLDTSDAAIMRPGMSVRLEVVRRSWDRALLVPRQAVHRDGERMLVTKPGAAAPIAVSVAACTPIDCVVTSGLEEGDRVLLR